MIYLIDTDTLSPLLRPAPPADLLRRFAALPADLQFTSSITVGEMLFGAARLPPERADRMTANIDALLTSNITILPFDTAAARVYAHIRATLERAGTPIGEADTRIAAIAVAHGLTMVTGNVRHFRRVPDLAVENWLT